MRQNTHLSTRPVRDAGVALIIALAVLALLLVLLIAFLASSILEHRIAFNQSSQVASRLAVRSAMTRVVFQLKNYGDDLAWFRTEDNIANKATAPLVSSRDGEALTSAKTEPDDETCAMSALTPLLEYYLTVKNYFPKIDSATDKTDYYPQWIDLKVNLPPPSGSSTETHLTGRYAYVVIPNLGIAPAVMGSGATARVGGEFKELPLTGLLTAAGITRVTSLEKWLSFELMTGGKGIYNDAAFYNITDDVKGEFAANSVTRRELANFYFTPDVWKFAEKRPDDKWLAHKGDPRINLKGKQFTSSELGTLTGADGLFGDFGDSVKEQVAANLIDYTDSDDTPTSDVAPSEWKTSTSHPKYTCNELTPYINQIVPIVQAWAVYTVPQVGAPDSSGNYSVTRSVAVKYRGYLLVELINIYPEAFTGQTGTVFIKDLKITGTISLAQGTGAGATEQESASFTIGGSSGAGDFTTSTVSIGARTYAVVPLCTLKSETEAFNYQPSTAETVTDLTKLPKWYVTGTIESANFDRAVLTWNGTNVDYVQGRDFPPSETIFLSQNNETCFQTASTEQEITQTRFGGICLSLEAIDPRCNLKSAEEACWDFKPEIISDTSVPDAADPVPSAATKFNMGSCNHKAKEVQNIALVAAGKKTEKYLEPSDDPVNLSTAYIRNGAMQSPWELALIHRGTPWQTVNLRSALHPMADGYDSKKGSYLNDAILLERIRFSDDSGDDVKACKFNINLPAQHESAFGVLTKGLHYHEPGTKTDPLVASVTPTSLTVAGDETTALTDAEAKELAKWIANKCYDATDKTPADPATSANAYQRYLHRGMLANVIMDWALNAPDTKSPFKGKPLKEAHLSELIGKIVPLTRCGDTYEYFTVFAVGQAIKDFGGGNKFYKYDSDGKLINTKESAAFGTFDDGIDQITAQTYLVARIRREVTHCEGKDCCKLGIHDPGCTFKLTVLESYTLDEL